MIQKQYRTDQEKTSLDLKDITMATSENTVRILVFLLACFLFILYKKKW